MLFLTEAIAFELDHPAYRVRGLSTPQLLVAAAQDGRIIERGSGKLFVLGFDGSPMFGRATPLLPEGSPEWMTGGYTDCETYLLCAANVSKGPRRDSTSRNRSLVGRQ